MSIAGRTCWCICHSPTGFTSSHVAQCCDNPVLGLDLRCKHGNASGACSECRNGVDPTTGDVA